MVLSMEREPPLLFNTNNFRTADEPLKDTYGREFNLPDFTMNDILAAIPAGCFNRSAVRGLYYVVKDLLSIAFTGILAHYCIPRLPSVFLRFLGWIIYGFIQGCFGTGLWVMAHECGHQSLSRWPLLNDSVGWVLHSFLLVPYFSWKITHGRHHKATGHMSNDVVLVPKTLSNLIIRRGGDPTNFEDGWTEELYNLIEEAPIASLYVFTIQHTLGWPGYLLLNITGQKYPNRSKWAVNHFNPTSPLFTRNQYYKILASDLGVALAFMALVFASRKWGLSNVLRYYLLPYLWVNSWLVLITYLQHTDPALPHYRGKAWNFQRGAAATMDRDFGFIGEHIFHDILKVQDKG
jgi:omega-6 fatty acid desaturase / acyl-lipid omega-6 desaturase (Delta-12 desaturase)